MIYRSRIFDVAFSRPGIRTLVQTLSAAAHNRGVWMAWYYSRRRQYQHQVCVLLVSRKFSHIRSSKSTDQISPCRFLDVPLEETLEKCCSSSNDSQQWHNARIIGFFRKRKVCYSNSNSAHLVFELGRSDNPGFVATKVDTQSGSTIVCMRIFS